MLRRYVAGLAFDPGFEYVALVHKNRPEWQRGKWNAVGGKVEPGELARHAVHREWHEECVITLIEPWHHFCTLSGPSEDGNSFQVTFYYSFFDYVRADLHQMINYGATDEPVEIVPVKSLNQGRLVTISNIPLLIEAAKYVPNGAEPLLIYET